MSLSPYRIMRPFVVSFSGGRSSAYMLRRILDQYKGKWPNDAYCLFANTGKEQDETLDFVHEIETRWGVPVRWLEYAGDNGDRTREWREVDYETAHRTKNGGSPFEALLKEMSCLPNVSARVCTVQLKIKTMRRFLESQGWDRTFHRRQAIGIRFDESDRAIQIRADCAKYIDPQFPMISDEVSEPDVMKFWSKQSFDLKLRQHEGNCDFCFLKSKAKLVQIAMDRPEQLKWWLEQEKSKEGKTEKPGGAKFRQDRTFADVEAEAERIASSWDDMDRLYDDLAEDDEIPCSCGTGVGDWLDPDQEPEDS